jgi:hypothetical protein
MDRVREGAKLPRGGEIAAEQDHPADGRVRQEVPILGRQLEAGDIEHDRA